MFSDLQRDDVLVMLHDDLSQMPEISMQPIVMMDLEQKLIGSELI